MFFSQPAQFTSAIVFGFLIHTPPSLHATVIFIPLFMRLHLFLFFFIMVSVIVKSVTYILSEKREFRSVRGISAFNAPTDFSTGNKQGSRVTMLYKEALKSKHG